MAAGLLDETPAWQAVPYFTPGALLTGGPDSADNPPIQALTNRSAYLKQQIESALGGAAGIPGHLAAANPHPQYVLGTALPSEIDAKLAVGIPQTPVNSAGGEVATAKFVRDQIDGAGKNADGIRTARVIAAGTDFDTIIEHGSYNLDTTGSANAPPIVSGVWCYLDVLRHSNTGIAGANVICVQIARELHGDMVARSWERKCVSGVWGVWGDAMGGSIPKVIDHTGATTPISLAIGDTAIINVSASASVPLLIDTLDNEQYELYWFGASAPADASTTVLLLINDLSVASSVSNFYYAARDNNMTYIGTTLDDGIAISVPGAGGTGYAKSLISTRTAYKHAQSTVEGMMANIKYVGINTSTVSDVATAWVSLGTVSFGQNVSGKLIIKRIG